MADLTDVLADLAAEGADLDGLVASLDDWSAPTPAQGWTISHQIGHLAWTDDAAYAAIRDPERWDRILAGVMRAPATVDDDAGDWAARSDLLDAWRGGRAALVAALPTATGRLPWFGPPMSATSMATARLMETWAHGQDVADALGVVRRPTERLRHVAHIGVRTRDFAYAIRGERPPDDPFRVELDAPTGGAWSWGPDTATQSVTGPALDFCLLVTQRRHRDGLALTATGADADHWLDVAQAFAGPPGPGRPATRPEGLA